MLVGSPLTTIVFDIPVEFASCKPTGVVLLINVGLVKAVVEPADESIEDCPEQIDEGKAPDVTKTLCAGWLTVAFTV